MDPQLLLERRHVILKNELHGSLDKKRKLESKINQQFEALKRVEISLEKHFLMVAKETK